MLFLEIRTLALGNSLWPDEVDFGIFWFCTSHRCAYACFIPNLWFWAYLWPKNLFKFLVFQQSQLLLTSLLLYMSIDRVNLILGFSDSAQLTGVHRRVLYPIWGFGHIYGQKTYKSKVCIFQQSWLLWTSLLQYLSMIKWILLFSDLSQPLCV